MGWEILELCVLLSYSDEAKNTSSKGWSLFPPASTFIQTLVNGSVPKVSEAEGEFLWGLQDITHLSMGGITILPHLPCLCLWNKKADTFYSLFLYFQTLSFHFLQPLAERSLMNELCLWCLLASSRTCYQNFNNMGSSMLVCVLCSAAVLSFRRLVRTLISLSKSTQEEKFKILHASESKLKQKSPTILKCSRFLCMLKITESLIVAVVPHTVQLI